MGSESPSLPSRPRPPLEHRRPHRRLHTRTEPLGFVAEGESDQPGSELVQQPRSSLPRHHLVLAARLASRATLESGRTGTAHPRPGTARPPHRALSFLLFQPEYAPHGRGPWSPVSRAGANHVALCSSLVRSRSPDPGVMAAKTSLR